MRGFAAERTVFEAVAFFLAGAAAAAPGAVVSATATATAHIDTNWLKVFTPILSVIIRPV
ncbi:hypothetical protein ISF6_4930 [Piscinibacter sakaiensis]|uniref:Uncharacterized protein n=1 Tax=Piscinibacter sakaiensis TaxID=1547922 RepID=A0A0K8P776_PISS1|nr:hypothetical protein ISF6_4930 [Piscinibacter sakaiensis]